MSYRGGRREELARRRDDAYAAYQQINSCYDAPWDPKEEPGDVRRRVAARWLAALLAWEEAWDAEDDNLEASLADDVRREEAFYGAEPS